MGFAGPLALAFTSLPFLFSAFGQSRVRTVEPVPAPGPRDPVRARIKDGLLHVSRTPALRRIVHGSVLRSFGIGIVDTVLLLFAYRALGLSSVGGGLLLAAGALGGLAGAVLATRLIARIGVRRTLLLSGLEGAAWIALPFCLPAAPVVMIVAVVVIRVVSSVWLPVWAVLTTGLRQTLAPPGHESTVHATARTLVSSATPAGSLAGGLAAGLFSAWLGVTPGLVVLLAAGGLLAACSALLVSRTGGTADRPELVAAAAAV
jgi:MFS family permease